MDCLCGYPVHSFVSRDGKVGYNCSRGRCKFFATSPVQCSDYLRILSNASTPVDNALVRFEACLHPDKKEAKCYTGPNIDRAEVYAVLEDPQFQPQWHTTASAYMYPMSSYQTLVSRLRALRNVQVQEIPRFFFNCLDKCRSALEPVQLFNDEESPLEGDAVYQQLKPFQKKGVEFIVRHSGRGMIADSMGLGKTVQAICVAHFYRDQWPVLVVCPMSLTENWMKEFNRFAAVAFSRMIVLQNPKMKASSLHDVVIVSYSSLKNVEGNSFKMVILDESHYIKAAESQRARAALALCSKAERVVLLSGTPAMSRPIELHTQLQAIFSKGVPTKTQFGARYCNAYVGRFGVDYTGHMNENELHYLLRNFMIRRTKSELGAELPSKTRQILYVTITEKERKAMEKQVAALSRSMTVIDPVAGGNSQTGSSVQSRQSSSNSNLNALELKVATARAKIPAVQDYVSTLVEEHLETKEKVIFFAHHQCMMDAIREAVLKVRPKHPVDHIFISGETPAGQREESAEHFRNDPNCPVAVLSMQSSGTGHNFTCASTVVFAELDWNPSTHLQCEDRVHRIGQSNPCTIKYLLAEGTSDTIIWALLQNKLSVTNALLETKEDADHLKKIAEKTNVQRRDVTPVPTQGTLDGFLTKSQTPQKSNLSVTAVEEPDKNGKLDSTVSNSKENSKDLKEKEIQETNTIVISLDEMEKRGLRPRPPRGSLSKAQLSSNSPKKNESSLKSDPILKMAANSVLQMLHHQTAVDGQIPLNTDPHSDKALPAHSPVASSSLPSSLATSHATTPTIASIPFSATSPLPGPSPKRRTTFTLGSTNTVAAGSPQQQQHQVPSPQPTVFVPPVAVTATAPHSSSLPACVEVAPVGNNGGVGNQPEFVAPENEGRASGGRLSLSVPFKRRRSSELNEIPLTEKQSVMRLDTTTTATATTNIPTPNNNNHNNPATSTSNNNSASTTLSTSVAPVGKRTVFKFTAPVKTSNDTVPPVQPAPVVVDNINNNAPSDALANPTAATILFRPELTIENNSMPTRNRTQFRFKAQP